LRFYEQSLQEEVDSHQEMAKGLDVSGTYIKYFGRKRDVVVIQSQLYDAKLRWKRLIVRSLEKGRHLQQAYRKSKQVFYCFSVKHGPFQFFTVTHYSQIKLLGLLYICFQFI